MLTQSALSSKRQRKTFNRRAKAVGRSRNAPSLAVGEQRYQERLAEAAKGQTQLASVADGLKGESKPLFVDDEGEVKVGH
jgi:hypothetical protein